MAAPAPVPGARNSPWDTLTCWRTMALTLKQRNASRSTAPLQHAAVRSRFSHPVFEVVPFDEILLSEGGRAVLAFKLFDAAPKSGCCMVSRD